MIKRIIDKETSLFLRDDFVFDEKKEIGLNVPPAKRLYRPKWNGEIKEDENGDVVIGPGEWVEGLSQEEIDELNKPVPQTPTADERIEFLEQAIIFLSME